MQESDQPEHAQENQMTTPTFLSEIIECLVEDEDLFGAEGPCPVSFEPGDARSRILIVTGENAAGKSIALKAFQAYARRESDKQVEVMRIGMEMRSQGGIERSFVFSGSEDEDSTGTLSINAVLGAIRTSIGRERRHMLLLDEPDIGLSEGYQAAVGCRLRSFMEEAPALLDGLVVATHSRPLVSALMDLKPHCLRVGSDLRPTAEWLRNGSLPQSMEDLERLHEIQVKRWRNVTKILRERNKTA